MQQQKIQFLAYFTALIALSTICFAQASDCGVELIDESKGMHAVMENCKSIGTYSIGGLYNGNWEKLTYFYPKPWAGTFITIKVGGKIYVNSHQATEGIQMDQYVSEMPSARGNKLSVKWMLPEQIQVEESIELIENISLIHLTITNQNPSQDYNVGARIHLDTMLGDNDGAPIYVPGDGLKESEKEYRQTRNLNYKYWKAYNRLDKPTIVATGILDNENKLTYPDKLLIADWKQSVKTAWDYDVKETTSIMGDSAVILYYDTKEVRRGQTREILTGYGSGEPVLKKITEVTEIILSNISGEYCMGEEALIKVDAGSRIDFLGGVNIVIKDKTGQIVYEKTAQRLEIPAETVKSTQFTYSIPLDVRDETYTVTAKLIDSEDKQIDEKQTTFSVDAKRCGITEQDAGPNWLLIALILIILLTILLFIATRKKGEVIVKKTKQGHKVIVSVYNASEETLRHGVIEDRIPEGAEVDMLTLHVKRKGTHLRLDTGTLHPGQRVTLEYKIRGVNVVPKAVYRWDGGEKHTL